MLFALAIGAVGFGGLMAGCGSGKPQKQKDSHDGAADSGPPSASKGYPLTIEGSKVEIYHQDLNGDGLVQPETEALTLKVGDAFIRSGSPDFEKYRKDLHLPSFKKLADRDLAPGAPRYFPGWSFDGI